MILEALPSGLTHPLNNSDLYTDANISIHPAPAPIGLNAFGSVLREDFRGDSDVDLLYELDRKMIPEDTFLDNFFGLYDSLKILLGSEVDLIKYHAIQNPYFLKEID